MNTDIFGQKLADLYPVVEPNLSDSGSVDTVLEFLVMAGQRSLPEAVMTMVKLPPYLYIRERKSFLRLKRPHFASVETTYDIKMIAMGNFNCVRHV